MCSRVSPRPPRETGAFRRLQTFGSRIRAPRARSSTRASAQGSRPRRSLRENRSRSAFSTEREGCAARIRSQRPASDARVGAGASNRGRCLSSRNENGWSLARTRSPSARALRATTIGSATTVKRAGSARSAATLVRAERAALLAAVAVGGGAARAHAAARERATRGLDSIRAAVCALAFEQPWTVNGRFAANARAHRRVHAALGGRGACRRAAHLARAADAHRRSAAKDVARDAGVRGGRGVSRRRAVHRSDVCVDARIWRGSWRGAARDERGSDETEEFCELHGRTSFARFQDAHGRDPSGDWACSGVILTDSSRLARPRSGVRCSLAMRLGIAAEGPLDWRLHDAASPRRSCRFRRSEPHDNRSIERTQPPLFASTETPASRQGPTARYRRVLGAHAPSGFEKVCPSQPQKSKIDASAQVLGAHRYVVSPEQPGSTMQISRAAHRFPHIASSGAAAVHPCAAKTEARTKTSDRAILVGVMRRAHAPSVPARSAAERQSNHSRIAGVPRAVDAGRLVPRSSSLRR